MAAVLWAPADYAATEAEMARSRSDSEGERIWLERALRLDPENAELHYRRGLLKLANVNPPLSGPARNAVDTATASFERATELNPLHYLYAVALTDALDIQGMESEGLQAALMAIRAAPQHEEARLALALHYSRFGKFDEAERAFLWVKSASAQNAPEEMSWYDYYQTMLKIAQQQSVLAAAKR